MGLKGRRPGGGQARLMVMMSMILLLPPLVYLVMVAGKMKAGRPSMGRSVAAPVLTNAGAPASVTLNQSGGQNYSLDRVCTSTCGRVIVNQQ